MLTFPESSQGDIAPNSTRSGGLVKTWHFWCDTMADETSANVSSLIARIGRVERSAEVAATGDWERPWESIIDADIPSETANSPIRHKTTTTRTAAVYSVDRSIDQSRHNSLQNCNCSDYETVWSLASTNVWYILSHFIQELLNFDIGIHKIGQRTIWLL